MSNNELEAIENGNIYLSLKQSLNHSSSPTPTLIFEHLPSLGRYYIVSFLKSLGESTVDLTKRNETFRFLEECFTIYYLNDSRLSTQPKLFLLLTALCAHGKNVAGRLSS